MDEEWAVEKPRKKLATPYGFSEKLVWLKNNLLGPSKKFKELTDFIPQKSTINEIVPKIRLGFLGDIMGMRRKELEIGPRIKEFFSDCKYLVGNFEGTLIRGEFTGKRVFMAQDHTENILSTLETLFPPERFVLTNANNHSGDFGWEVFNRSYELLSERGFKVIGRRDKPSILLDQEINVVSCTKWSNQPRTPYIVYLDEMDGWLNPEANFNILSPHWGYEMQLYPNSAQIESGQQLLENWDLIVGHHSHCPQPITSYTINNVNKVLAFSLGDFCIGLKMKKYHYGIVVKADIGPDKMGTWKLGELHWKFTQVHVIGKKNYEVKLEDKCKYLKNVV